MKHFAFLIYILCTNSILGFSQWEIEYKYDVDDFGDPISIYSTTIKSTQTYREEYPSRQSELREIFAKDNRKKELERTFNIIFIKGQVKIFFSLNWVYKDVDFPYKEPIYYMNFGLIKVKDDAGKIYEFKTINGFDFKIENSKDFLELMKKNSTLKLIFKIDYDDKKEEYLFPLDCNGLCSALKKAKY